LEVEQNLQRASAAIDIVTVERKSDIAADPSDERI
jgi:hypothetical protein